MKFSASMSAAESACEPRPTCSGSDAWRRRLNSAVSIHKGASVSLLPGRLRRHVERVIPVNEVHQRQQEQREPPVGVLAGDADLAPPRAGPQVKGGGTQV